MLTWHFGKHKKMVQNTRILMPVLMALFIEEKEHLTVVSTTIGTGFKKRKPLKKGFFYYIYSNYFAQCDITIT